MVSTSLAEIATLLPPDLSDRPRFGADERPPSPHILLVTDGAQLPPGNHVDPARRPARRHRARPAQPGGTSSRTPPGCGSQLAGEPPEDGKQPILALRLREEPIRALADQCDLATAEAFARRLAPLHTVTTGPDGGRRAARSPVPPTSWTCWAWATSTPSTPTPPGGTRPARDRLRVPIGVGEGGATVHLDIKESAQQGMGPHGLVIGATGSGKSEFLRTLVLGLAMTHSPEQLNLVLVDFKGGATFAGMSEMPHVSAMITNLAQELTLVDRMQDALSGEMIRRQELLREAGNFASVRDYEKARAAGEDLDPLPSLFIVVDEFSEMLSAKPEFIDLFVAIGRLGRSLGLHLLLASQRLEEGRLRGLESHLSYRVGLRTFSAGESRSVLGVPDAYELPPIPGLGLPQARPVDAWCGSRRRTSPGRRAGRCGYAATRAGTCRASCRSRSRRCRRWRPPSRSRSRRAPQPTPVRQGEQELAARRRGRADGRPRAGGPPGLAAAARRARHPRPADAGPRGGPRARRWSRAHGAASAGWSSRSAPSTGPASNAATR